jgi:uncharacterized protein YgiM (DUF1202 family)
MKSYVWLTFAFLGWGYYEMSGGADFEPEQRQVAIAEVEAETPEVVTRANTTTLLSVSTSNASQPVVDDREVTQAVAEAEALGVMDAPEVVEVVAPVVEPKPDLREVAGSRVNMRMGPSTDFEVITTLNGGTKLEVLEVTEDGWANVTTVERGIEGWMAERLLTDSET